MCVRVCACVCRLCFDSPVCLCPCFDHCCCLHTRLFLLLTCSHLPFLASPILLPTPPPLLLTCLLQAEYRVSVYGRRSNELTKLGAWFCDNDLDSDNVRWLIQVPRL